MFLAKIADPLCDAFFFFGSAWDGIEVGEKIPGGGGFELSNLIRHGG